jgi:hypothetical protein
VEAETIIVPEKDRTEIRPRRGGLGFSSSLVALAVNLRLVVERQPGTPLRVLSLVAIDAASRLRGNILKPEQRQAVIDGMELGALLNDRFDGDAHDRNALSTLVGRFAQSGHRKVVRAYAKRLRALERLRPHLGGGSSAIGTYRENVNRVSLGLLWALAGDRTLASAELEIVVEEDLRLLFRIVMQTQVIDDVLDVRLDRRRGLPSFASGPDASAHSLGGWVSVYSDPNPIRLDQNFCLQITLRIVAALARALIKARSGVLAPAARAASGSR